MANEFLWSLKSLCFWCQQLFCFYWMIFFYSIVLFNRFTVEVQTKSPEFCGIYQTFSQCFSNWRKQNTLHKSSTQPRHNKAYLHKSHREEKPPLIICHRLKCSVDLYQCFSIENSFLALNLHDCFTFENSLKKERKFLSRETSMRWF